MPSQAKSSRTLMILNHLLILLIFLGLLFLAISMLRVFTPLVKVKAIVMDQKDLDGLSNTCPSNDVGFCVGVAYTYRSVDYTQRFILPSSDNHKMGDSLYVYIQKNKPAEASLNPPRYLNLGAGIFLLVIDALILAIVAVRMSHSWPS